jgi:hypothetical protein
MMIEKRRSRGRAYGRLPWHCFGSQTSDKKTNKSKIWCDLRWLLFDDSYATTNQKQVLMMEKGKERRFDWGGARGGRDSIVLGVIELGYCKNLV